jgi:hypothetical protein
MCSIQKIARAHPPLCCGLHLKQAQGSLPATLYNQIVTMGSDYLAVQGVRLIQLH